MINVDRKASVFVWKLTNKQIMKRRIMANAIGSRKWVFAQHYCKFPNAYEAALKAGYEEVYARSNSHKLLRDPEVKELVNAYYEQRGLNKHQLQDYMIEVIRGDIQKYVVDNGTPNPSLDIERLIADEKFYLVEGWEPTRQGVKYKLPSRSDYLDKLARVMGLYKDAELSAAVSELKAALTKTTEPKPDQPDRPDPDEDAS
jgi:phage terminase small subunit